MNIENIQLITLPKRGLRVIPPLETAEKMRQAKTGQKVLPFSAEEKYRLRKLIDCSILKQRYPTKQDGERFMNEVDLDWREQLLNMAQELSDTTVKKWRQINDRKDIAVVLYGSVAKGLTKKPGHEDPSNIDLGVIGNFGESERHALYNAIRPTRIEMQNRILARCSFIDSPEANPGNAGVSIQDLSKLRSNFYYGTRMYISAGAFALYDNSGIWEDIEKEAITFSRNNTTPRGKRL